VIAQAMSKAAMEIGNCPLYSRNRAHLIEENQMESEEELHDLDSEGEDENVSQESSQANPNGIHSSPNSICQCC